MSTRPSPEQIAKLPQWAQEHIRNIESERTVALRALNDHLDAQTKSVAYWEEYLSTGEGEKSSPTGPTSKRFYVQSDRMTFECAGVRLEVSCHPKGNSMNDPGINLQWTDEHTIGNMVALVPRSFQQMTLIAHHNMRVRPVNPKLCAHDFEPHNFCRKCGWRKQL